MVDCDVTAPSAAGSPEGAAVVATTSSCAATDAAVVPGALVGAPPEMSVEPTGPPAIAPAASGPARAAASALSGAPVTTAPDAPAVTPERAPADMLSIPEEWNQMPFACAASGV